MEQKLELQHLQMADSVVKRKVVITLVTSSLEACKWMAR